MTSNTTRKTVTDLIDHHLNSVASNSRLDKTSHRDTFFDKELRCLSVSEVAHYSGLSPKTIERLIKAGTMRAKKVGRRMVIPLTAYELWLQETET